MYRLSPALISCVAGLATCVEEVSGGELALILRNERRSPVLGLALGTDGE
jgi:hypothetical protein